MNDHKTKTQKVDEAIAKGHRAADTVKEFHAAKHRRANRASRAACRNRLGNCEDVQRAFQEKETMRTVKIPVAAPGAGLYFDNRSEQTDWQKFSNSFKAFLVPRMFYSNFRYDENGLAIGTTSPYRRTTTK